MASYPRGLFDRASAGRRRDFLWNLFYVMVWLALALLALVLAARWLWPFAAAFLTAALLQRPLRCLTKLTRAPKGFVSGALVVVAVLLLAAAVFAAGWQLWRLTVRFLGDEAAIRRLTTPLIDTAENWKQQGRRIWETLSPETRAALSAAFGEQWASGENLIGSGVEEAAAGLWRFATEGLPSALFGFLVWVIASVFLTVDYPRVTAFLRRQIPPHRQAMVTDAKTLCSGTMGQLFKAYLLLMALTFGELTAGLLLLRVPWAVGLAALIALVDLLPVLGVGTVLLPWAAVAFVGGDPGRGAGLLVLYLVITVVRNLVEPRLISERVGLPPVVALLCLYIGWKAAGLAGVVLLPLLATVLLQLQRRGHLPLWK